MFAKTLIKLIDYAIFPAILIVSAKVVGIAFFSRYFDIAYEVEGVRLIFDNAENFKAVNSYSSLFMFFSVAAGLLWVSVKAHLFHDSHITPSLSAKLFGVNLNELIHTTEIIYSQSFIWLSYAWTATVIFGVHSYFGLADWWVFFVAFAVTVLATAALAIDIEREVMNDKKLVQSPNVPVDKVVRFAEEIFVS